MPAMLAQLDFPRRPTVASRRAVRHGPAHSPRREAPCGFSRRQKRSTYDPYGRVTVMDGNAQNTRTESLYGNPWTWQSRRLDSETGLMYFRQRMYSTDLGRFVSRYTRKPLLDHDWYQFQFGQPSVAVDPYGDPFVLVAIPIWKIGAVVVGFALTWIWVEEVKKDPPDFLWPRHRPRWEPRTEPRIPEPRYPSADDILRLPRPVEPSVPEPGPAKPFLDEFRRPIDKVGPIDTAVARRVSQPFSAGVCVCPVQNQPLSGTCMGYPRHICGTKKCACVKGMWVKCEWVAIPLWIP
jgi:RHS repeat-associated protein